MGAKIKDYPMDDLASLMQAPPRQTPGATVAQRRGRSKRAVPITDRRRRPEGEARTEQYNVRVTPNINEAVHNIMVGHDLTKAELTERALRFYIANVRAGNVSAGLEEGESGGK